jgi:hypothetical protein
MRTAFNFYKSYYDVAKELNDKDRLLFFDALMKKQFENIESNLNGLVKFAYLSQKHSIDRQVKGYFDKTKDPMFDPCQGGAVGGMDAPYIQEKEEGKGKGKEEEEQQHVSFDERVNKFLLWFNSQKEVNGFRKGNFSVLSKATESNFKKILKTNYSSEQLNNAFKNMCNNTWVRENNKITPDHFLRIDNLEKYINQEDVVSNKSEDARVNHIKDLIEKYGTVK